MPRREEFPTIINGLNNLSSVLDNICQLLDDAGDLADENHNDTRVEARRDDGRGLAFGPAI